MPALFFLSLWGLKDIKEHSNPANIKIKEVKRIESSEVIESNVLGRLGRVKLSHNTIEEKKEVKTVTKEVSTATKVETDFKTGVPSVPGSCSYTVEELRLIQSEDEKVVRLIHHAKTVFGGIIIPPESISKTGKVK